MGYQKSPFNYTGNKFKQLPQLMRIFPQNINCFVDLFTGGGDVVTNVAAKSKIALDINKQVIEIMQEFQRLPIEDILAFMDKRIEEFELTKTNKEGYLKYRELYNNGTLATPLDLYTLSKFSFNNLMRFNEKLEMNAAFGANRSSFNPQQRKNTILFHKYIQDVDLRVMDFRDFDVSALQGNDFVYADPPYLISAAVYNTGAKQAGQRWEENDECDLLAFLSKINEQGVKFALSNLIKHKGKINQLLLDWVETNQFNMYDIYSDYSHCVYHVTKSEEPTIEVVITNYENVITEEKFID